MNQKQRIIEYIRSHGSITTKQAVDDLGILRPGARISELRRQGYDIGSKTEEGENRYGEKVRYNRYFLTDKMRA